MMVTLKFHSRLVWSTAFLGTILAVALISKDGQQPEPIYGAPSQYTITMNVGNAPTRSTTYGTFTQTIKYSEFNFENARYSPGSFVELAPWGRFYNTDASPITSITNVIAYFNSPSALLVWTGKTFTDPGYSYSLSSGVSQPIGGFPNYIEFLTTDYVMLFQSVTITYTCIPSA